MLNEILMACGRAVVSFALLMIVMRVLGRKALSQMTYFDLAIPITFGSLAANTGMGTDKSLVSAGTVMIVFAILGVLCDLLTIKSRGFRIVTDGEPRIVIQNGELRRDNLRKARVTLSELLAMLRQDHIFNIADVEYAILENDGQISVLPKSPKRPVTPSDLSLTVPPAGLMKDLIIDGKVIAVNLQSAGLDESWLREKLRPMGIGEFREVLYAGLDSSGGFYASKGTPPDQSGTL